MTQNPQNLSVGVSAFGRKKGNLGACGPGTQGLEEMTGLGSGKTSVTNFPTQKFVSGQPAVENMTLGEAQGLD